MQGCRIKDLPDLIAVAQLKRSVVVPCMVGFKQPRPAAFVQNLQAVLVQRMIERGMYLWLPEAKGKKK